MPAKSKSQQQFMGIVHGIQKGEIDPKDVSPEARKAAKEMDPKDAKKFAKTKHKGLPKHVKKECDEPYTEKIEEVKKVVKYLVREILQEGPELSKLKQFLTSKEFNLVKDIVAGRKEIDDYDDLYQKLFDYWQDEMPYGTQKARSGDPYEWIFQKLDSVLSGQKPKLYWSDTLKKNVTIPEETIKEVSSTDLTNSKVLKIITNNKKKIKKLGGPVDVAIFGKGSVVISKDKTTFSRTYLSSGKWKAKPADNSSTKNIISDDEAAEIVQKIFS